MSGIHRRKSSKEDDSAALPAPPSPSSPTTSTNGFGAPPRTNGFSAHAHTPAHNRSRTMSTPTGPLTVNVQPPTAVETNFPYALPSPTRGTSGVGHRGPGSPLRASFSNPAHLSHAHARTRSVSTFAHSPSSPSPLSTSFPTFPPGPGPSSGASHAPALAHSRSSSFAGPVPVAGPGDRRTPPPPGPSSTAAVNNINTTIANASTSRRHHARLHSRNLSVFFPRPGQGPAPDALPDVPESPAVPIPPASPQRERLGEGFTFGARPPADPGADGDLQGGGAPRRSRKGHHHKHSLSHNFFSFLEPGAGRVSPSMQMQRDLSDTSARLAPPDRASSTTPSPVSATSPHSHAGAPFALASRPPPMRGPALAFAAQFALGAALWVAGQQAGSLACTGLGYWVVFDAIGVAVARLLPAWLRRPGMQNPLGRPYGNPRVETVALFSQGVYLMFSAVYVFKETVEHLLLSAGEGHHHHPGDEEVELLGIEFPLTYLFLAFLSLTATALAFDNHSRLVSITDMRLPSLSTLLDPSRIRSAAPAPPPTTPLARLAENPYSAGAVLLAATIAGVSVLVPATEHRACDLLLAAAEACAMGVLAYPICARVGTVLLQTAPARGAPGGRTEAFLRAMREIERHPDVQHLPPPHVWQLTPHEPTREPLQPLVVALELRVSRELADADVLALTRWAAARCASALGLAEREAAEWITVGIVRG